jgi:hypothetical protein
MEVKGATLLYTLAGLMITFAGFSALLFVVRQAAGARLSLLDRYLARTVMTHIFVLTGGALLPALFGLYDMPETWIWRDSGVLFALPMLSLQVTYPHRRRKVVGKAPPPAIIAVFVVLGSAVTLAMLGYVLAGLQYSAAAYITALTIDFFTVVFGFVTALDVIMQQPVEVPEQAGPIEDRADEEPAPVDDEVQGDGMFGLDQIADAPVTAPGDGGDSPDRDRAQEMTSPAARPSVR